MGRNKTTDQEKLKALYANTVMVNGCREWTKYARPNGYAFTSFRGGQSSIHRSVWTILKGQIPVDMHICHKCDNRKCINIDHLFVGTRSDNMQDKVKKGRDWHQKKTHCPQGHEYSPENLYYETSQRWRICKICKKASKKRTKYRKKLERENNE